MKKRKRAPGGGRKAGGEFRQLTAVMSLRMPQDLRDQLESARKASGRTLSQELLWRASGSFDRDRDLSRDRALRAFCFLFSELAKAICISMELQPDWRFDPWYFQTFKLAIPKLLDRFQPAGKMKLPGHWQAFRDTPDIAGLPLTEERRQRTESPEAMADYAVQKVLSDFSDPGRYGNWYKGLKSSAQKISDPQFKVPLKELAKQFETTYYGMSDAVRDLAPSREGGKS
jgi:hypothetical protein